AGQPGYVNLIGTKARFDFPRGVASDHEGNIYVSDRFNHCIRNITPSGIVSTLAGPPPSSDPPSGFVNGPANEARFNEPYGIVLDRNGNIFVADTKNAAIRKVTPDGMVSTLASGPDLSNATGMAIDAQGNLYVTTAFFLDPEQTVLGSSIVKVTPAGV